MFLIRGMNLGSTSVPVQASAFTYLGKLIDTGSSGNGTFDSRFKLFSVVSGDSQSRPDAVRDDVQVTSRVFAGSLDFGTLPFTTATGNFLEMAAQTGGQFAVTLSVIAGGGQNSCTGNYQNKIELKEVNGG